MAGTCRTTPACSRHACHWWAQQGAVQLGFYVLAGFCDAMGSRCAANGLNRVGGLRCGLLPGNWHHVTSR
jgi:hypothetical protein